MSYTLVSYKDKISSEYCDKFPDGLARCISGHYCNMCPLEDRIRINKSRSEISSILFDSKNCLRQTPAGGGENFYNMPLVLTEKAMDRYHVPKNLFNQIVVAYGGAGCFPKNKGSVIDVFLLADPERRFLITRYDIYGIPNMQAVEKYEELFFMGLKRYFK